MVFLIVMVFALVPLVGLFACTATIAIALSASIVDTMKSRLTQFAAASAILASTFAITRSLITIIVPRLPDFRTPGDGGAGLAYNLICKIAIWLMSPALGCFIAGFILHTIVRQCSSTKVSGHADDEISP